MPFMVFEVRSLSRGSNSMSSHLPATFKTAHPTATRHPQRELNFNRLPCRVRPKLTIQ